MTRRERMESVLNGAQLERTPVCIRLNLWYNDCKSRGALPDEIRDLTCGEVEDHLGFIRSSRYAMQPALKFRSSPIEVDVNNSKTAYMSSSTTWWSSKTLPSSCVVVSSQS